MFIIISNKIEFCDSDWTWRDRFKGEYHISWEGQLEYEDGTKEIGQWVKHKRGSAVSELSNIQFIDLK